jgi:hypothetical protein
VQALCGLPLLLPNVINKIKRMVEVSDGKHMESLPLCLAIANSNSPVEIIGIMYSQSSREESERPSLNCTRWFDSVLKHTRQTTNCREPILK